MTLHTDTARLIVRKTAEANGWTRHGENGTWDRDLYRRGDVTVNVRFGVRGGVASAEEHGGGVSNVAGARNKRETVIGWLTEAPATDPAPSADEADLTALDCTPSARLLSCAHNADRSNFTGLGLGPCSGLVRAYGTDGITVLWMCDGHAAGRIVDPVPLAEDFPVEPTTTSDRDAVYDAHLGRGWAMFGTSDRSWGFRRDDVWVSVSFAEDGELVEASRVGDAYPVQNTRRPSVVIGWLTEAEPLSDDLHARALDENADRDRARIANLEMRARPAEDQRDAAWLQVAELERQAANKDQAYREVRERVTELEDQNVQLHRTLADRTAQLREVTTAPTDPTGNGPWQDGLAAVSEAYGEINSLIGERDALQAQINRNAADPLDQGPGTEARTWLGQG